MISTTGKCGSNFLPFSSVSDIYYYSIPYQQISNANKVQIAQTNKKQLKPLQKLILVFKQTQKFTTTSIPTLPLRQPMTQQSIQKKTQPDFEINQQKQPSLQHFSLQMARLFTEISTFCIEELRKHVQDNQNVFESENKMRQQSEHSAVKKKESEGKQKGRQIQKEELQNLEDQLNKNGKKLKFTSPKPQFMLHKPKAPASSYLLFLHEHKASITARYNITNVAEVTKLASLEWKNLSQEEREKYSEKCLAEKQRYKEEMEKYRERYMNEIIQYRREKQSQYRSKWKENRIKEAKKQKNEAQSNQPRIPKKSIKTRPADQDSDSVLSSEHNFVYNSSSKAPNDRQQPKS